MMSIGMMSGLGPMIAMMIFAAFVVAAVVLTRGAGAVTSRRQAPATLSPDSTLESLKARYERGENDHEEFKQGLDRLLAD